MTFPSQDALALSCLNYPKRKLMSPINLRSNQPPALFYQGGPKVRAFRNAHSAAALGNRAPEDLVGSITRIFTDYLSGLTTLPDGSRLKDAIDEAPGH